jgi:UDP-N-acetylmuramyl pentapeptide synthase
MTWAELHGVLVERGLVPADPGLPPVSTAGFVTGIAYDSRTVEPGNVFVALKGRQADGSRFARQAIERGAVAVVSEEAPPLGIILCAGKREDTLNCLSHPKAASTSPATSHSYFPKRN